MKKKLLIMLLAMLMLLQFCACGNTGTQEGEAGEVQDSAQISSDKEYPVILIDSQELTKSRNTVLSYVYYLYGAYNVQFKLLSQKSSEREAELTSLRIEIMSGGGPDAFILPCDNGVWLNDGGEKTPFFTNVEKMMHSSIFLPMDDLIEQSEYLNMEDHYEVIMNAGKTEEGQMVLPLLYNCNAYFINKDSLPGTNLELNSWEDVLTCKDEKVLNFLRSKSINWFGSQYTQFVDYEGENVSVTPEEIAQDLSFFANIPRSTDEKLSTPIFPNVFDNVALEEWAKDPDKLNILTVPNEEGGLTATVTAYAAINRNTEYAEEVFKFIELLFSEEIQNNEGVYLGADSDGMYGKFYGVASRPGTMLLGTGSGIATHKRAYPDAQGELIAELTAKVNTVRFSSDLDTVLSDKAKSAVFRTNEDEEYFQDVAEDICDEMEMMLAE